MPGEMGSGARSLRVLANRPRVGLLSWLGVLAVFVGLAVVAARHTFAEQNALVVILFVFASFGIFGAVWMANDALRYEERPLRFVLGALAIMFVFVWYYLDRVRWRNKNQRISAGVRNQRHA